MARRGPKPKPLIISDEDRLALERVVAHPKAENREVQRARIVLLAADGMRNVEIAERVGVKPVTVNKWRRRFREAGYHSLTDLPRAGRPRTVTDERVAEVVKLTLESRPKGATQWSTRSPRKGLESVSHRWPGFGRHSG